MQYTVVIHKDPGSSYGVTVPDLPSCFSGGDTFEDAMSSVREAIYGHIELLLMEGDAIPEQKPLQAHKANEHFAGGTWASVSVDLSDLSMEPTPSRL